MREAIKRLRLQMLVRDILDSLEVRAAIEHLFKKGQKIVDALHVSP